MISYTVMEIIVLIALTLIPLAIISASVIFLRKWKRYKKDNTPFAHGKLVYLQNIFMLPLCINSPIVFLVMNSDFGMASWMLAQEILLLLTGIGYIIFAVILPLAKLIKKDEINKVGLYRANAVALLAESALHAVIMIALYIFLPLIGA